MILAYVAGPFRGPNHWAIAENIRNAERVALDLWRQGVAVYCPHANTAHFQGASPDEVWLEGHLAWMRLADVVVVLKDGERSSGTVAEVQEALRLGIPVFLETGWRVESVSHDPATGGPSFDCVMADLPDWIANRRASDG